MANYLRKLEKLGALFNDFCLSQEYFEGSCPIRQQLLIIKMTGSSFFFKKRLFQRFIKGRKNHKTFYSHVPQHLVHYFITIQLTQRLQPRVKYRILIHSQTQRWKRNGPRVANYGTKDDQRDRILWRAEKVRSCKEVLNLNSQLQKMK